MSRVPPADATVPASPSLVVIGCGALGRELVALLGPLPGVVVTCLAASLHNRPERIPAAVSARLAEVREEHGAATPVFVAYADCGTGGLLDATLEGKGVERLPVAHCYEVYAGSETFAAMSESEPGTFYLTDFLARQFDTLVWRGLKLDRHPQLVPQVFGNYTRLVYLAQTDDPALDASALDAATRLGLSYERRATGIGGLATLLPVAG